MSTMKEAARHMEDEIEHDAGWLGAVVGGLIGFAVAVAFVVTFPVSAGVAALAISAGAIGLWGGETIGRWIGKQIKSSSKDILSGSPNVTVGGRQYQAARAKDPVKCHPGKKIAFGAKTISINLELAARVDEKTQCNGKIKTGCPTVTYGGPSQQVLELDPELPAIYRFFRAAVNIASFFVSVRGAVLGIGKAITLLRGGLSLGTIARAADQLYDAADVLKTTFIDGQVGEWYSDLGLGEPPAFLQAREFTNTRGYQTFNAAWSTVGLGRASRDAYQAYRAPEAPRIQTPEAPQGTSRTSGGVLTLDPPEGMARTNGGVIVRDVDVSQGIEMRQRESGLWVPSQHALPPTAPRPSPILGADGAPVPPVAPRMEPPALVGPTGAPLPPQAPPLSTRIRNDRKPAVDVANGLKGVTEAGMKLGSPIEPRATPFVAPPPVQAPAY